jgi:U1 small nuclear ribonucleoprotein of 70kDa MW N terminal.
MTQFLPANLLALFTARPPIPFKPPPDGLKKRKNETPYIGLADFLHNFEVSFFNTHRI